MKICIVYGSSRKGNTYRAVQIVKERLLAHGDMEFTEFFPSDFPPPCAGCYTCFMADETKCPHRGRVGPISDAMLAADGLIFATPAYVLEMSGQMKLLLDHFGYQFMPHRPRSQMFGKTALVLSTAAGGGTKQAMAGIVRSLWYWGISRIYQYGFALYAMNWDEMKEKKRAKHERALKKAADRFYNGLLRGGKPSLRIRAMFFIMRNMVTRVADNPADREYWRAQGWTDGKKPW